MIDIHEKIYPIVARALVYKAIDVLKCEVVLLDFNLSKEAGPYKNAALSHAKEAQRIYERVFELTKFNLSSWIEGQAFLDVQESIDTIKKLLAILKRELLDRLVEASIADEKTAVQSIIEIRKTCENLIASALTELPRVQESIDTFIDMCFSQTH